MPQLVWIGAAETYAQVLPPRVSEAMAAWNVRSPAVGLWLRLAGAQMPVEREARVVLEFDEAAGLLSFDAWVDDARVYGADDWVG